MEVVSIQLVEVVRLILLWYFVLVVAVVVVVEVVPVPALQDWVQIWNVVGVGIEVRPLCYPRLKMSVVI